MPAIRVLLVADDPLVRGGLGKTITDNPDYQIVGSLSGDQFDFEVVDLFRPDLIIWDTGWDPTSYQEIGKEFEEVTTPVLVLVADIQNANALWLPNLRAMLFRDASTEQLFAALSAVSSGVSAFDPQISSQWMNNRSSRFSVLVEPLTDRESEVLSLLAEGLPNKAIARKLAISDHTVKFHVNSIMGKLGAQSRTDAVVRATRLGIIHL